MPRLSPRGPRHWPPALQPKSQPWPLSRSRPSAEPGARLGRALVSRASAYSALSPAPTLSPGAGDQAMLGCRSMREQAGAQRRIALPAGRIVIAGVAERRGDREAEREPVAERDRAGGIGRDAALDRVAKLGEPADRQRRRGRAGRIRVPRSPTRPLGKMAVAPKLSPVASSLGRQSPSDRSPPGSTTSDAGPWSATSPELARPQPRTDCS